MNHGKQIRREIGRQFSQIIHKRQLLINNVAKENNMSALTLDEIELGFVRPWTFYHRLKTYYNCEIKVIEKTTN